MAIGAEVFGLRAGPDMVAAIREGRFEYSDFAKAIAGGRDTIGKAAADTNDWRESLTLLKNKALVALEPALSAAFGGLSKAVDAAGKALTSDKAKEHLRRHRRRRRRGHGQGRRGLPRRGAHHRPGASRTG